VRTADETWACDEVLVTVGIDTPSLAAQVGVQVPTTLIRHARLTFALRRPQGARSFACWIDQSDAYGDDLSIYAVPVGTTGRYAVGVSAGGHDFPGSRDVEDISRRSASLARRYVPATLPGLDPLPVAAVRCAYKQVGLPEGDGFRVERRDAVTILYGNNLPIRSGRGNAADGETQRTGTAQRRPRATCRGSCGSLQSVPAPDRRSLDAARVGVRPPSW